MPPVQSPKKLKTLDDVDQALHELSWLQHQRSVTEAKIQQEIDEIKARRQVQFEIEVNGDTITLSQRCDQLQAALETWCESELGGHLVEPKKSLDLPHGRVGKRDMPLAIQCSEDKKPKDVFDLLDRKSNWRERIAAITSRLLGKVPIGTFVEFKPSLCLVAIRKAFEGKLVTERMLNGLGLSVRKKTEENFFEVSKYDTDPNNPA